MKEKSHMELNDFSKASFNDIVFEGRNQRYGAYRFRRLESRDIYLALFLGLFIFFSIIYGPVLYKKWFAGGKKGPKVATETVAELTLATMPQKQEKKTPLQKQELKVKIEKFVRYEPKLDNQVQEEPLPDSLLMATKNLGAIQQEGLDSAFFDPGQGLDNGDGDGGSDEIFLYVDEEAFYKGDLPFYLTENYVFTAEMATKGQAGTIYVAFTVNIDGSLSDIQVLKGKGLTPKQNEEAIRVIRSTSGNWQAAKINGAPVRSYAKQKFEFQESLFDY